MVVIIFFLSTIMVYIHFMKQLHPILNGYDSICPRVSCYEIEIFFSKDLRTISFQKIETCDCFESTFFAYIYKKKRQILAEACT